jgi:hypothetical protein
MAISDTQKVDFLFKKLGFGIAKTDVATAKSPSNESIASPMAVYSGNIWAQADQIPATAPGSTSGVVEVRKLNLTMDATAATTRTYLSNLADWIPGGFGATYAVKVYRGDPDASGVQIFPDGSGANDEYFFDYQAGVLNFIGTTVPSGVDSSNIWIKGFRYTGSKGLGSAAGISSKTHNFANIGTRDAATVVAGDFSYVTDAGNGEWALFIATTSGTGVGANWIQITDQDASDVDARTVTQLVNYNSASPINLGKVSPNRRPETVAVEVLTAFDGTATLTIGDANVADRLMTANENDLSDLGLVFMTYPVHQYATETELRITFAAGGASVGQARVTVTYS